MEWDQCTGERSHQLLESQQSYETEWDMVNAVSFKKKTCQNGDGEASFLHHVILICLPVMMRPSPTQSDSLSHREGHLMV